MEKSHIKEQIKTISIVVLIIASILLLYFLWKPDSFKGIDIKFPMGDTIEKIAPADVVEPNNTIVNLGGSYALFRGEEDGTWLQFLSCIKTFSETEGLEVEQIREEDFVQVFDFNSIYSTFHYSILMPDFCSIYDIVYTQNYDSIENISLIGYSTAIKNSLFISDEINNRYYRIFSNNEEGDAQFFNLITMLGRGEYDVYYPMKNFTGLDVSCWLPLDIGRPPDTIFFETEVESLDQNEIALFAERFFGEHFDFVRKITESNGTIIYMYDYAQRILIINKDGSFEYKEEPGSDSNNPSRFLNSLNLALNFISSHGGFQSLEKDEYNFQLRSFEELTVDRKKGYRFRFDIAINNYPVYHEEGDGIIVEIVGSQVIYYKRSVVNRDENSSSGNINENVMAPLNVLTSQHPFIRGKLVESGVEILGSTETELYDNTMLHINGIEIAYLRVFDEESLSKGQFIPVWAVETESIRLFFDIKTGEPIDTSHNMSNTQLLTSKR